MSRFCVVEGTKITLNGKETISIERIKVGQEILSFDLNTLQKSQNYDILVKMKTNDFEGIFQEDLVKNVWKNTADEYYLINNKLKITKDHIVMAKRDQTYYWTKVEKLLIDDYLFTELNIFERIESIIIVKEKVKVFNLEVNRVFNYFANSYLIHNGAPCTACAACGFISFTLTLLNYGGSNITVTLEDAGVKTYSGNNAGDSPWTNNDIPLNHALLLSAVRSGKGISISGGVTPIANCSWDSSANKITFLAAVSTANLEV